MSSISRRDLVGGAAVLASALAAPVGFSGEDPLRAAVASWRARWEADERGILLSLLPDGKLPKEDPLFRDMGRVARGLASLRALDAVRDTPARDQVHGAVQGLIAELGEAYGEGLLAARDLLVAAADTSAPERTLQLRGGLRALRMALGDWDLSEERRGLLEGTLLEIEGQPGRAALRAHLKKLQGRLDKGLRIARQAVSEGRAADALGPPDREVAAEVALGQEAWGASATPIAALSSSSGERRSGQGSYGDDSSGEGRFGLNPVDPRVVRLTFGLMMSGASMMSGYVLVLYGACLLFGGWALTAGAAALLVGLSLMALAVWAGGVLSYRTIKDHDPRLLKPRPSPPPPGLELQGRLNVHPEDGWVATPYSRSALAGRSVRARGRVHGPWGWIANPDGDGVAAGPQAPMPGAPEASLIARVGEQRFYLGADGVIPAGADGPLELALNIDPAHRGAARGFFHVTLDT